uniref:VIT family protein n=1 Tax=Paramoeba aestuarina TaxID=180227 RepID=A0A7S4NB16_9EUKA|mmetsp:Transcript_13635/g.21114  ORF Transcript_13635/g.21114 Transcript_13635/m.21114 type:complete len:246 (+) Transcript_13635:138-875(+)|eukprot:CAMPEP_0201531352 /NCGR_PEP_ID=MMETSP0161_2-20130828/47376_1 /ASSEMBLY_ACC=CAM_ASM_000251 /TAXON_ID=180227 /ORGANISM="Neoparamoeba aestuarina, Strain SoJaBio B1-5/56/2" /LENGTH=245 /DNA_ID=CAMNT_0047934211 /DNA_START=136 /DNA_END=873 /DNA_ORIENTATION=-
MSFIKEELSSRISEYIKSVVFGALDGVLTTFAVIMASQDFSGAYHKAVGRTILVVGFATALADAFAMAFGEFFSSKAKCDHVHANRKRVERLFDADPEEIMKKLIHIYMKKGISKEGAHTIARILAKERKIFLDVFMAEHLREHTDITSDGFMWKPVLQGVAMFIEFVLFGSVSLLAYVTGKAGKQTYGISCTLVGISLFTLGALKGRLTHMSIFYSGAMMLFVGFVVAVISFAIAALTSRIFHV